MAADNNQYKDRLFNFLFGSEENKAWTLSLYNAVNGSAYMDPSEIEITTIQEVMYLGMHNDVSFLISDEMDLYEQQSTFNPNMPLRMLQYAGNLYEKYIEQNKLNKFGDKIIRLPVPKLVVFYNGTGDQPDEKILKLSDSFPEGADADIQVKVRMLNVNAGRNKEILSACKPLEEYAWLVDQVRTNNKTNSEEGASSAIDRAISAMPDDFVIKPFLEVHRVEVKGMLLTEYNEAKQMQLFKEDGRREGIKEGREEGRIEGRKEGREEGRIEGRKEGREAGRIEGIEEGFLDAMVSLVRDGILTIKDAATRVGITEDVFQQKMAAK